MAIQCCVAASLLLRRYGDDERVDCLRFAAADYFITYLPMLAYAFFRQNYYADNYIINNMETETRYTDTLRLRHDAAITRAMPRVAHIMLARCFTRLRCHYMIYATLLFIYHYAAGDAIR